MIPGELFDGVRNPVPMLFVRCEGGVSHNPLESVAEEDVATAVAVLERFLEILAAERD